MIKNSNNRSWSIRWSYCGYKNYSAAFTFHTYSFIQNNFEFKTHCASESIQFSHSIVVEFCTHLLFFLNFHWNLCPNMSIFLHHHYAPILQLIEIKHDKKFKMLKIVLLYVFHKVFKGSTMMHILHYVFIIYSENLKVQSYQLLWAFTLMQEPNIQIILLCGT